MSKKIERVNDAIQKEIGLIIKKEIADPRIDNVTITDVDVSPDLKNASVYVSAITTDVDQAIKALRKAKGFIKLKIGERIRIKYLPDLKFEKDETIDEAMKIERIIKEIHKE